MQWRIPISYGYFLMATNNSTYKWFKYPLAEAISKEFMDIISAVYSFKPNIGNVVYLVYETQLFTTLYCIERPNQPCFLTLFTEWL